MTASPTDYAVEADLNYSGGVDFRDNTAVNNAPAVVAGEDVVSTVGCIIGYTGHVYDEDVQLHLARHRWLDPEDGRWVSRDPLEYMAESNLLYEYANNSPLSYSDPYGLFSWNPWDYVVIPWAERNATRKARREEKRLLEQQRNWLIERRRRCLDLNLCCDADLMERRLRELRMKIQSLNGKMAADKIKSTPGTSGNPAAPKKIIRGTKDIIIM